MSGRRRTYSNLIISKTPFDFLLQGEGWRQAGGPCKPAAHDFRTWRRKSGKRRGVEIWGTCRAVHADRSL